MSLLKRHTGRRRHVGRRVAGVAVGVSLIVLGLEAPAFAAPPTIAGISPTSGPVGCVVAITGTGFDQPGAFDVDTVNFTGAGGIDTVVAEFLVVSDTEIWTTVPVGALTGAITVTTDPGEFANSAVFTVTTLPNAGGCAPTIASFTPTCGVVGTTVTITGTNLLASSNNATDTAPVGGTVLFNPYNAAATAAHTGAAESPTTLVVNVPPTAVDGPIRVTTPAGTVTSTESFNVVTDATECGVIIEPTTHPRSITFNLRRHRARGVVRSTEDPAFTECVSSVPVKIQRRRAGGGWQTVRSVTTNDAGAYKSRIPHRAGRYRARATRVSLGDPVTDVCLKATSPARRHRH